MTQLPIGQTPQAGVPDARIDPALAGGPTVAGALARGAKQLGDVIQRIEDRNQAINQQRQTAAGRSQILVGVAEAQERASQADPMDSQAIYEEGIEKTREEIEGTTDDSARETLLLELETRSRLGAIPVRRDSTKRLAASAIDQYVGLIDNAILVGDEAAVRGALEGVRPLLTNKQFIEFRDQTQGKIETVKIETLETAIDAVGRLPLEQRQAAIDFLNQAVKASGLSATDKLALDTQLKSKIAAAERSDVTRLEALATDAASIHSQESIERLKVIRDRAENLTDKNRERIFADVDAKIHKIETAGTLSEDTLDKAIQNKNVRVSDSRSPSDLNANYNRRKERGLSDPDALRDMIEAGTEVPEAAVKDIKRHMDGLDGTPSIGVLMLSTIHGLGRPVVAERIALNLSDGGGDPTGARAGLQAVTSALESNQPLTQINETIDNPRYSDMVVLGRQSLGLDGVELGGEDKTLPSPDVLFVGFNETVREHLSRMLGVPAVDATTERRFQDTYAFHYADLAFRSGKPLNDVEMRQRVSNEAFSIALDSIDKRFVNAPTTSPTSGIANAVNRFNAPAVLNEIVGGPGADTNDQLMPAHLVGERSEEYRAGVFDALNASFQSSVGGRRFISDDLRANTVVDSPRAFDDDGLTVTPIIRTNDSGTPLRTIGFLIFNKFDGSHRVVFSESEGPIKPSERDIPVIQFFPLRFEISSFFRSEAMDKGVDESGLVTSVDLGESFSDERFNELQLKFKQHATREDMASPRGFLAGAENTTGDPTRFLSDLKDRQTAVRIVSHARILHMRINGRPENDDLQEGDNEAIKAIAQGLSLDLGYAGIRPNDDTGQQ